MTQSALSDGTPWEVPDTIQKLSDHYEWAYLKARKERRFNGPGIAAYIAGHAFMTRLMMDTPDVLRFAKPELAEWVHLCLLHVHKERGPRPVFEVPVLDAGFGGQWPDDDDFIAIGGTFPDVLRMANP